MSSSRSLHTLNLDISTHMKLKLSESLPRPRFKCPNLGRTTFQISESLTLPRFKSSNLDRTKLQLSESLTLRRFKCPGLDCTKTLIRSLDCARRQDYGLVQGHAPNESEQLGKREGLCALITERSKTVREENLDRERRSSFAWMDRRN
jgi:hypothetical protein